MMETMEAQEILASAPERLLPWFAEHARPLPWRADREPYHVWLSEIMLQQTRAEAVKAYYARFLSALPGVAALAQAQPDTLTKLWEGLGYYARVRALQRAAREIMERHGGVFPSDYAAIRALPGIGDYTAGAIASICFEQPTPAVDGNVLRVAARLTGDRRCVDEASTRRAVREALAAVYPAGHCGEFTQALMELGATVCLPNGAPACSLCPMRDLCVAAGGGWKDLPVRREKKPRRRERMTVFLLRCGELTAICRRADSGLLAGLWEFPNVPDHLGPEAAVRQAEEWGVRPRELLRSLRRTHVFTHVEWDMQCWLLRCAETPDRFVWASPAALRDEYALPTAFRMFRDI